eukprot:scaffold66605_cov15-Tisochrysis_lutea.AAC.1
MTDLLVTSPRQQTGSPKLASKEKACCCYTTTYSKKRSNTARTLSAQGENFIRKERFTPPAAEVGLFEAIWGP